MTSWLPLLAVALLPQQPGPAPEPPESILVVARAAHHTDSAGRVLDRWEARIRRNPDDRPARFGLATLAHLRYDLVAATEAYEALIAPVHPPDPYTALAYVHLGLMTLGRESFDSTRRVLLRGEAVARALSDSLGMVEALALLGFLASRIESTASALAYYDRAVAVTPRGFERLHALVACMRAPSLSFGGVGDPVSEAARGLAHARASGDLRTIGFCHQSSLSVAINATGDQAAIRAHADSAEAAQRTARDNAGLASTLFVRGYAAYAHSDYAKARTALRDAIVEAERGKFRFADGWSRRFLGEVYWLANDAASADEQFRLATDRLVRLGDQFGLFGVARIRAAIALELGRVDEADSLYGAALQGSEAVGLAEGIYSARLGLADVRARRGDYTAALRELDRLDDYGRTHGHAGWSSSLGYRRGLFSLRLGDLTQAERHFRGMLGARDAVPFDRYAAGSRLAEVHVRRGQPELALQELTAATDALDQFRASLDDQGLRLLVFQTRQYFDEPDLGLATIVAGVVEAGLVREGLALVERRRARTLTDQLAAARIFLESGSATPGGERTPPTSATAHLPDSGSAVLEYLTGGRGQPTTVFVLTPGRVEARVLSPLDSLAIDLSRFAGLVRAGGETGPAGRRLRMALLDPALAVLPRDTDRLLIVSDGELHHLPWEALPLEEGHYLGTSYRVSHAASAGLAAELRVRPRRNTPASILALGDPVFDGIPAEGPVREAYERTGGLPPLPASGREARAAARFGEASIVRLGRDASESFLKRAPLADFAILHLATHALVDDQHLARTSLALAGGEGEDGFLTPGEISALPLAGSMVVLSACRTAGGVVVGGEGVQGLSSALLAAGARAVLATRWPVEDTATQPFLVEVYQELARGRSVDDALRHARLNSVRRGAPAREWAAFVVIGDGSLPIPLRSPATRWWGWAVAGFLGVGLLGAWMRRWFTAR